MGDFRPNRQSEIDIPCSNFEFENYLERKTWFREHVGKQIYGLHSGINTEKSNTIYEDGIFINSLDVAMYMYAIENSYINNGVMMKFFSNIEERSKFESELQKSSLTNNNNQKISIFTKLKQYVSSKFNKKRC